MNLIEELQYYAEEINESVNRHIDQFNTGREKSRIKSKLKTVKHSNKLEILNFLFKKLSHDAVKDHLGEKIEKEKENEEIERQRRQKLLELNEEKEEKPQVISTKGYSNILYTKEGSSNALNEPTNQLTKPSLVQKSKPLLISVNPFNKVIGDPQLIAENLIDQFDTEWPAIPWHEGKVLFKGRKYNNRFLVPFQENGIKALQVINIIGGIMALLFILGFMDLWIGALENRYNDFNYVLRGIAMPEIAIYFAIISIFFPLTAIAIRSNHFNYVIDNSVRYISILKTTHSIQKIVYPFYVLLMLYGSYKIDYVYDPWGWYYQGPVNGYDLMSMVSILFIPTLVYVLAMRKYSIIMRGDDSLSQTSKFKGLNLVFQGFYLIYYFTLLSFTSFSIEEFSRSKFQFIEVDNDSVITFYIFIGVITTINLIFLFYSRKLKYREYAEKWYKIIRSYNIIIGITLGLAYLYTIFTKIRSSNHLIPDYYPNADYFATYLELIIIFILCILYTVFYYFYFVKVFNRFVKSEIVDNRITKTEMKIKLENYYKKARNSWMDFKDKYL